MEILHIKSSGLEDNVKSYNTLQTSIFGLISMCLLSPVTEELICRGFLLTKLSKVINIKTAIILQAIFFGLLHGNVIQFADTFVMGIIAGCICYYTKSVFPSIIIHITNNTVTCLDLNWFDKHQAIGFIVILALLGIFIYTLWGIFNKHKSKTNFFKKAS